MGTKRLQRRWSRLSVGWKASFICLAILLGIWMMNPTPASGAQAVEQCTPSTQVGCVNGKLQDSAGTAIGGVTVTLSGAESATTTTTAEGTWAFAVEQDGSYTVTIPKEVATKYQLGADSDTVTIKKSSFGQQRAVVRFDKTTAPSTSSSTATPEQPEGKPDTSAVTNPNNSTGQVNSNIGKRIWQQLFSGILFGLMLGLMSVGMNLVYGTTGLSSFSHGEQVTLGGLMAYVGTQIMHMPVWLSAIFAVAIGALTGLLQNQIIWQPLRRRRVGTMQQLIVTIGLSMALQYIYQFFFGGNIKGITKAIPDSFDIGPITTNAPTLISGGIALATIIGVTVFLYATRLGRATRAVSDNAALAAASGINVDHVVRIVWVLACALAALAGVLLGIYLNGISWNTGATLLLLMFAAVTLGGLGTANGALVGALIIGIVADMSSLVIPNDMRYASALAILIVVLLVRPQGIFGKKQRVG